jgi:O6-methylguanine-DNA--protein-cysteine methyltransferase
VRVAFEDHADFAVLAERGSRQRGPTAARVRLREVAATLEGYFAGDRVPAPDVIDWRLCTVPGSELLLAVQQIAYAGSSSYELLGGEMSPYDRGHLIGLNPLALLIPSHRVSCGSLRPEFFVGGTTRLAFLRKLETL